MRTATGIIYGFGVLSESEGSRFSVIIQHTLRSLQGTESILRLNEAYLYNNSCIVNRGQWLWNHYSIFFFTFFNHDLAQNKDTPRYIGQWANKIVLVWSMKHNEGAWNKRLGWRPYLTSMFALLSAPLKSCRFS